MFWIVISAALVEMRHRLILHAYPLIRLFFSPDDVELCGFGVPEGHCPWAYVEIVLSCLRGKGEEAGLYDYRAELPLSTFISLI